MPAAVEIDMNSKPYTSIKKHGFIGEEPMDPVPFQY
jgi:hypothetical protein